MFSLQDHLSKSVFYLCWSFVLVPGRRISRPSGEDFHIYATNGAKDKMKEALRQYPDLVDVEDNVSTMCAFEFQALFVVLVIRSPF